MSGLLALVWSLHTGEGPDCAPRQGLRGRKQNRHAEPTGATMTIPRYINEHQSDIRSIKVGWYAMDAAGKLSSGPFSSHEECLSRGTRPTNRSAPAKVRPPPK